MFCRFFCETWFCPRVYLPVYLPSTAHTGAFQELEIAGKNLTKSNQNRSKQQIIPPRRQETHNLRITHASCFLCHKETDRGEAADVTVGMFTCHILVGAKVHVVPGCKRSGLSCRQTLEQARMIIQKSINMINLADLIRKYPLQSFAGTNQSCLKPDRMLVP